MTRRDFEFVENHTFEPFLNGEILRDGARIECLWADGTRSRHKAVVRNKRTFTEHIGSYPGFGWIERGSRNYASIQIHHRGTPIEIPLSGSQQELLPKCRLIGRQAV